MLGNQRRHLPTCFQGGSDTTLEATQDLEAIALILGYGQLLPRHVARKKSTVGTTDQHDKK